MFEKESGVLFLVATPIGNIDDLSSRAMKTLSEVDLVACEDTRRTGQLFKRLEIGKAKFLRVDSHTEEIKTAEIVNHIKKGLKVALVSDAGTPSISDPGERLVKAVIENGLRVSIIPGPSAAVAALAVSGLPTERWVMEGFLPRKGTSRKNLLKELTVEERTIIIFESPKRLPSTLLDLEKVMGPTRLVSVIRELTKVHEEIWRGTLDDAVKYYSEPPKGEIVIVLAGSSGRGTVSDERISKLIFEAKKSGATTRDAAEEVARHLSVSRSRAYRLALEEKI